LYFNRQIKASQVKQTRNARHIEALKSFQTDANPPRIVEFRPNARLATMPKTLRRGEYPVTLRDFDVVAMVTETLLAFIFVSIERLGAELRDPFENRANDTHMSAICRTIEIDLRQQLGETRVPPPLEPVKGVLM
jgi:hypothetical protein